MTTLEVLHIRWESLAKTMTKRQVGADFLKKRLKVIKKEIADIHGAIIKIDHMIESL